MASRPVSPSSSSVDEIRVQAVQALRRRRSTVFETLAVRRGGAVADALSALG